MPRSTAAAVRGEGLYVGLMLMAEGYSPAGGKREGPLAAS